MIRKSVKEFLVRNVSANDDYYISENQLSIFDEIDDENDVRADDENGFTLQDSPHN
ncbi:MAG: hypothetical protein K8S00_03480 [Bacteroidales bacterium]|nr:hypothetical protein [Bacteroidales bacterium]